MALESNSRIMLQNLWSSSSCSSSSRSMASRRQCPRIGTKTRSLSTLLVGTVIICLTTFTISIGHCASIQEETQSSSSSNPSTIDVSATAAAKAALSSDQQISRTEQASVGLDNAEPVQSVRKRSVQQSMGVKPYQHSIMRFGRAPHNIMHFGKRANDYGSNIMHFGKRPSDFDSNIMHFGKRASDYDSNIMHFGKRPSDFDSNIMHFGKRPSDFDSNIMHFGKRPSSDYESNIMHFGKRHSNDYGSNIMHFGKRTPDYDSNIMHFGKRPSSDYDSNIMHFGKRNQLDSEQNVNNNNNNGEQLKEEELAQSQLMPQYSDVEGDINQPEYQWELGYPDRLASNTRYVIVPIPTTNNVEQSMDLATSPLSPSSQLELLLQKDPSSKKSNDGVKNANAFMHFG